MPTALSKAVRQLPGYTELLKTITHILVDGRAELEAIQIRIYWEAGHVIHLYREKHNDHLTEAGIATQLSEDLQLERSHFYRLIQFAKLFPNVPPASKVLTWTHYKMLLSVSDAAKRKHLTRLTEANAWVSRRLQLEIQKERGPKIPKREIKQGLLDEPERRAPGVCKVKVLSRLGEPDRKVVDLGFDLYSNESPRADVGETVRWNTEKSRWEKSGTKDDLYYYEARVERVVDGDTLLVHITVGGRIIRRQYLRLRGVNCAERDTNEGQRAKKFVEKMLEELSPSSKAGAPTSTRGETVPSLLIKTHLTDKYDRYISDVFIDKMYVNNKLLEEGLAVRV